MNREVIPQFRLVQARNSVVCCAPPCMSRKAELGSSYWFMLVKSRARQQHGNYQQGHGIMEGYARLVEKHVLTYLLVHILKTNV